MFTIRLTGRESLIQQVEKDSVLRPILADGRKLHKNAFYGYFKNKSVEE